MKIIIILFTIFFLAACNTINSEEPLGANVSFVANPAGPTGCGGLTTCSPCTNTCLHGPATSCVAQKCAFKVKCTDTPAVCVASCNITCVKP